MPEKLLAAADSFIRTLVRYQLKEVKLGVDIWSGGDVKPNALRAQASPCIHRLVKLCKLNLFVIQQGLTGIKCQPEPLTPPLHRQQQIR